VLSLDTLSLSVIILLLLFFLITCVILPLLVPLVDFENNTEEKDNGDLDDIIDNKWNTRVVK